MRFRVDVLLIGKVAPFGPHNTPSGILKKPARGSVLLTKTGLVGDEQGDRRHHGGPEKALHHYPTDHYEFWRTEIGEHEELASPGAFGENIASTNITEDDVCVGDVFRIGSALVQVSQGRQPCWKLNERFQIPTMARQVQESGRTGWYYRVLEEGSLHQNAVGTLIERPAEAWPLSTLSEILYHDTRNYDALAQIASLNGLSESWRKLARRRLENRTVENWSKRLISPRRKPSEVH